MLYRELPDSAQVKNLHVAITSKHNEKVQQSKQQQQVIAVSAGVITLGAAIVAVMLSKRK